MTMPDQIGASREGSDKAGPERRSLLSLVARAREAWQRSSLAQQFVISASLVMLPAMLVIGLWGSERIRESGTHGAGTSAALYIENIIEPMLQGLAKADQLPEKAQRDLDRLLVDKIGRAHV